MNVLLISTYELGHQPFGLASPAAWLRREGFTVHTTDCAIDPLPLRKVEAANLIAFYVPMHTATRLAVDLLKQVKPVNPHAHICFYGLYAPLNENYLRGLGVDSILGGEFEEGLQYLCRRLNKRPGDELRKSDSRHFFPKEARISLNRQKFIPPDRGELPPLSRYAKLYCGHSHPKITGYTETTRGCKHHCRHCPIVPVYNGRFRIVQQDVVMEDIRRQVEAGAQHITFGDPDFLNGPGHVLPIVKALHREFPGITYDVTIKIEHLLRYAGVLGELRDTGCVLVTSAVESIDDRVLRLLDKGHTRQDFIAAVHLLRTTGLALNPTFIPFHPWMTTDSYRQLLVLLNELDLVENISPVQYSIRLLIPEGSKLLELPETREVIDSFNEKLLGYEWQHPDPQVDELHQQITAIVGSRNAKQKSRYDIFEDIWKALNELQGTSAPAPQARHLPDRACIPYLNEPWYC